MKTDPVALTFWIAAFVVLFAGFVTLAWANHRLQYRLEWCERGSGLIAEARP